MSKLEITIAGQTYAVEVAQVAPDEFEVQLGAQTLRVSVPNSRGPLNQLEWLLVADRAYEIVFDPDLGWIAAGRGQYDLTIHDLEAVAGARGRGDGRVKAPIPGLITRVLVEPGETVTAGQPIAMLEAMKMENELRAPTDGVVAALHVSVGQSVVRSEVLAEIE
ncbi:MAG: biotin/lipoyl-binding protein [Chloroflexi bacterium]|nr:biotin/lipoyl-binding protein [Chloroflexota bacterium]